MHYIIFELNISQLSINIYLIKAWKLFGNTLLPLNYYWIQM